MTTGTPTSDMSELLGPNPGAERIYDNILATVSGTTLALIKLELWNTIEDFYTRSTFQRQKLDWQMAAGVYSVDFNPFDETWIVAWVLEVSGLTDFQVNPPAELVDNDTAPNALRSGWVLLALKPASFDVALPSDVWSTWFRVWLSGTLSRLHGHPARPYTAPQLATYHGAIFERGIARARTMAARGNTGGGGRWAFPGGFAGGVRKR